MGIRFRCHHCEHELNLKEFQAGRRARCPSCSGRFRVPTSSADFSVPLDDQEVALATSDISERHAASTGTFNLRPSSSDPDIVVNRTAGVNQAPAILTVLPDAIKEAPQAVWYVRPPTGGQYGPAEGHIFHTWLNDNRVSADCLVWRDGWPEWQMAGDVFPETFGANWRVAHGAPEDGIPLGDDTIDNVILDNAPATGVAPTVVAPVVSNAVISRRKKTQSTYAILIAVLFLCAIVLIALLVVVLWK